MTPERIASRVGPVALVAFLATIPAANWWLDRFGFWRVPALGPVPSGVVWVGLAFVLRDIAQLLTSKWHTLGAVAAGIVVSVLLASPALALASGVAFGISELLDWSIYTPLAERRFALAVALSSVAGSLLDSAAFVRIAFHSYGGWWQLAAAKSLIVLAVTPPAAAVRRALSRDLPE